MIVNRKGGKIMKGKSLVKFLRKLRLENDEYLKIYFKDKVYPLLFLPWKTKLKK